MGSGRMRTSPGRLLKRTGLAKVPIRFNFSPKRGTSTRVSAGVWRGIQKRHGDQAFLNQPHCILSFDRASVGIRAQ